MQSKDVDLYVEYTGTGLVNILKKPTMTDPTKVYNVMKTDFAKNYNMEVMKPLGFNNTYVIAVKQAFAKKNNLNAISDLAKISPTLNAGVTMEFANRPDGFPGV